MRLQTADLWTLVLERHQIDPDDLADALARQAEDGPMDYRSRMLVSESAAALKRCWGEPRFQSWLQACPASEVIRRACEETFDKIGFPSLKRRVMPKTRVERVRQFFEHLGQNLHEVVRIEVGGSIALILPGYLNRRTEDIDVVGEIPALIRENHRLLETLKNSYEVKLGHVQTHFPTGWSERVQSQGVFGRLHVALLSPYDIFLSKVFSARLKDQEDLRELVSWSTGKGSHHPNAQRPLPRFSRGFQDAAISPE